MMITPRERSQPRAVVEEETPGFTGLAIIVAVLVVGYLIRRGEVER
jgi:hypothetical protein